MKAHLNIKASLIAIVLISVAAAPYSSEKARAYISIDHGVTWQPADKGFPEDEGINTVVVHNSLVFAGTDRSGVWAMDHNGWSRQSKGLPKEARVLSLLSHNQVLYAGLYNAGMYYSTDDGETWHRSGNAAQNVRALGEFKGAIYTGTDDGIYRVDVRDGKWDMLLGGRQINTLVSNETYIYGGTHEGVVRSADGSSWEQVFTGRAIIKIAFNKNEVSIMDYSENVFRGLFDQPTFVKENIYLPHTTYFRLTPSSGKLIGVEWSELSFLRPKDKRGLPSDIPLNILVRTPFGLLAAAPSRKGC
ncbi:MAG: hypothetical protein QM762_11640 [Chryseolinea sp.]